ncbi:TIR domain-containing protein [Phenylobacterium sp. SCN 70-31]|uniref:TIR domain-containing protein n=1 Tax=Phenylobacterium sp. SCN 70-31 TaxID=1660129 RepID=UPI000B144C95|nr:TIR domain-containing protein [Phenylobacterium sp. SCN 70-31]
MTLKSRFEDHRDLVDALRHQKLVLGDPAVALAFAEQGELLEFSPGRNIIVQGESDRDVFFLLAGRADLIINGVRLPYPRVAGGTVGEMSAVNATVRRSATLEASEPVVAWKVGYQRFSEVATKHPEVWKYLATDLAGRVDQRNSLINRSNMKSRIFVICSAESLKIAKAIRVGLEFAANVDIWSDEEIFPPSGYPIEALEASVAHSDFGIALAEPDDIILSRDRLSTTPRDNVVFELGFFMARLGRNRTLLLTPRREEVKLPSDFKGLTPISYDIGSNDVPLSTALGPTIDRIAAVVEKMGVRASLIEAQ